MLEGQVSAFPHSAFWVQTCGQAAAAVVAEPDAQPTMGKKANSFCPHWQEHS
jgi:hypothetical protein